MFEMDKESFGQFLAQHRKEQGMTQSGRLSVQVTDQEGRMLFEPVSYTHLDVYKRQAVECVDIGRNTSGEGGLLGTN